MTFGIVLIMFFLGLIFLGMPISMGMGITAMFGLSMGGYDLSALPGLIEKGANNYTLIAIPYFLLAANLMNSVITSAVIMFLLGTGYSIGYVLTLERVPQLLTEGLLGITTNKFLLLLIINLMLLVLGCFIDGATIRIITVPLLLPIIDMMGISRIHFGIFHTVNLLIGYCTPPVGAGLMIIASITRINMTSLVKSFLPFFLPLLLALFILVYVPQLSTFLPSIVFGL